MTADERMVPVALRFEASPALQHSFNELTQSAYRKLAGQALFFFIAGNQNLPVLYESLDGQDASNGLQQTLRRYNHLLSLPIKGVTPYDRHFPVTQVDHFSNDDMGVDFALRLRTTPSEMACLRQEPFDKNIGNELALYYHKPKTEIVPLTDRIVAYRGLRQALLRGGLYVTHPTAVPVLPHVDEHSKF